VEFTYLLVFYCLHLTLIVCSAFDITADFCDTSMIALGISSTVLYLESSVSPVRPCCRTFAGTPYWIFAKLYHNNLVCMSNYFHYVSLYYLL